MPVYGAAIVLSKQQARRRIRAAMELADIGSIEELADRIGQPRLGARTLRKITDPKDARPTGAHEYEAIARATGVPVEFLTEPELLAREEDPAAAIADLRQDLADHDQHTTALYADIVRRLERAEETVGRLVTILTRLAAHDGGDDLFGLEHFGQEVRHLAQQGPSADRREDEAAPAPTRRRARG